MKDYREMSESVFAKGDAILAKRKKRRAFIRNVSISSASLCAAVIVGFVIWRDPAVNDPHRPVPDTGIISSETTFSALYFSLSTTETEIPPYPTKLLLS